MTYSMKSANGSTPESLSAPRHYKQSVAIWEAYQNHSLLPVITRKSKQPRNQTRIAPRFPSLRAQRSNLGSIPESLPTPRHYKQSAAITKPNQNRSLLPVIASEAKQPGSVPESSCSPLLQAKRGNLGSKPLYLC